MSARQSSVKHGLACLEVLKGLLDLLTRVHHKRAMLQADTSNQ